MHPPGAPVFHALELDDLQTRLYHELLDVPAASGRQLAATLALPLPQVEAGLVVLQELGLVSGTGQRSDQVRAAPPGVGWGDLLAEQRADPAEARRVVPGPTSRLRTVRSRDRADAIDAVHGQTAVEHRIAALRDGARSELLTIAPPQGTAANVDDDAPAAGATASAAHGVATVDGTVTRRVIVARSWLGQPGTLDLVGESVHRGEQVRVVDSVPLRLVIADGRLAVVSEHDPADPMGAGAMLVRPSSLLDGLVALFELLWLHGHPLVVGARSERVGSAAFDEVDRKVLGLLLAGLTDRSVGRQLGLSLRTVQRRARALMDTAGVGTRVQLGYEAARRGWV